MFIPTITGQGSDEQQERLLPLCNTLQIIGTYAQTELGHGTFVRGLETTATYHAPTQQFIIHSPTQTSTKWWPGGLGKTATHAVVIARLFVGGKDHGPHSFVVQLRSLETHKCLEGVQIGDIGPKFGYNGVDNGFLRFDHVLVGRDAMLSRFSQVLRYVRTHHLARGWMLALPEVAVRMRVHKINVAHGGGQTCAVCGAGDARGEVRAAAEGQSEGDVQHHALRALRHRRARRALPRQGHVHRHALLLRAPPDCPHARRPRASGASLLAPSLLPTLWLYAHL